MRQMLKIVRTAELDPEAGRTARQVKTRCLPPLTVLTDVHFRPDQLLIPDDPNFAPDLLLNNLEIDLQSFDLLTTDASSSSESVLSPHTVQSSSSSHAPMPELIIPSSSGESGGLGTFNLPGDQDFPMGDQGTEYG